MAGKDEPKKEWIDFQAIEYKWQKRWEDAGVFRSRPGKKNFYVLEMFPYPSASGLHMGHIRNYAMGDAYARFKRMTGHNVLYPMGYDAFGLPAENAAIKNNTHPKEYTEKSIEGIKKNQKSLGLSYDWSREIATCQPDYYKWNQWIFLKMLEKGLAYKKESPVNWCPKCETVLANEQVEDGKCWRCDSQVSVKDLEQWFFRITAYAEELLNNIDGLVGWPERVRTMQKNWIGRSEGTLVDFPLEVKDKKKSDESIQVFTTRPDTLYGVTFMLYAPDHPRVKDLIKGASNEESIRRYIKKTVLEDRFERLSEDREKEGIFTGRYCINPVNGERIPIWLANFVLPDYGTGAVMAVPAHDQRDFEFAKKYNIPIRVVIKPPSFDLDPVSMSRAYMEQGTLINSGDFDGSENYDAIGEITEFLKKNGWGKDTVQYKLRDWGISRQRYWGTPIPIIYCDKCGAVPVPEKDLPVVLPADVNFTGHGNPLEEHDGFVNTTCPKCNRKARRETDTMDTFVDSSWYFLRFCSPDSNNMFDPAAVKEWMPVDQYIGGAEHAVMHLLYARFFTMVLRDLGMVDFSEPFTRLYNQGIVYKDGHKMSKSFGNVVSQEEIAKRYGIDTARLFLLFVASPDSQMEWSDDGIVGSYKFLMRMHKLMTSEQNGRKGKLLAKDRLMLSKLNTLIRDFTEHTEGFAFNKAIGSLMGFVNSMVKYSEDPNTDVLRECMEKALLMASPFAPHMCEELWEATGKNASGSDFICTQEWPKADQKLIDPKLEAMEKLVEQTTEDLRHIIRLVGKQPKKATIYISPGWKYTVREAVAKIKDKKELAAAVMKDPDSRKEGKSAIRFAEKLFDQQGQGSALGPKEELEAMKEFTPALEKEFGFKIEVMTAEDDRNERSLKAEPGKPGIRVE